MSSSESKPESTEERELALVGKVEMALALSNSDTKFESLLKTYLAPLLLKLASEHHSVRNKVISVCQHVNTRIKPPSIKLPVSALLKQYKENQNPLIRHFDSLYMQQGFDRLPVSERLDLLPSLVHGLARDFQQSRKHAANLFNLFLRLLHQFKLPPRGSQQDLELRDKLSLNQGEDAPFIAEWIGKAILFTTVQSTSKTCPGLSIDDYDFLNLFGKPETWTPTAPGGLNLTETKVKVARFLASGTFTERERFLPALFASADANSRLSEIGDDILKRALPAVSLEELELLRTMYTMYLGTQTRDGMPPVRAPLQGKILGLFCKSTLATTFVPEIIQVVKEGLTQKVDASGLSSVVSRQGLEASKLRGQVFAFANWVARIAAEKDVFAIAPDLVGDLRSYVQSQGWPSLEKELTGNSVELKSRGYSYESIGLLAKACPHSLLLESDLELLKWLFQSLACDDSGKDVSISIEQALSSIIGSFVDINDARTEQSLTRILGHYITPQLAIMDAIGHKIVRSTRYAAVRFANRCLPYHNVRARYMDLLALSGGVDERNEVIEEAKKGLDPYWYRNLNPPKNPSASEDSSGPNVDSRYRMPDFQELVQLVLADKFGNEQLYHGFATAVMFCRTILFHHALDTGPDSPTIDIDWAKTIDALVRNDETARRRVQNYLSEHYGTNQEHGTSLLLLLDASFTGLVSDSPTEATQCGSCLLDLCTLGPATALDSQIPRVPELRKVIFTNNHSARDLASHIFGLLASRASNQSSDCQALVKDMLEIINTWKVAIGSAVHQVHGSILSIAYWLSRRSITLPGSDHSETVAGFIRLLLEVLNECQDKELLEAATIAVGQLSLFSLLTPKSIAEGDGTSRLISRLEVKAKDGDERSVHALGYFAIQCPEDDPDNFVLERIIEVLFSLHEKRQAELHFAVGSALSCVAIGWDSKSLVGVLDIAGSPSQLPKRGTSVTKILNRVLNDCKQTKPALRQAAAIWLLSLVQFCGHMSEVHSHLRQCQQAFKGFLSDRESLNQEAASRGLTIVYEKGDEAVKDDLIRDLVNSFTGTSASLAGSVSEDTQLFEPGALPTGDGSVTTYKDIVSLASEVGDPSLVYRFMSLASNSAIWSSRAAFGRFGLSKILSDSSADGYLAKNPKIYSALFRYRFDPNSNVRAAMNNIWVALVKDSKATIDAHFEQILEDLLKNILTKEWRVRQASCAAIADLLQGRQLATYEKYLTRVWTLTFKVCDDIKQSVRTAAMSLARVLTGILIRSLEAGEASASTASTMLKQVLPFLLGPSGLESGAAEVQAFSIRTLLDIIKKASGKSIQSFLGTLVGRLLALLSSIEPEAINYLHLNAEKYGTTEQQIDDARLGRVKSSPMMEAIERCLDMLNEDSMKNLDGHLKEAVKTVIGLPSKVGTSRVIVSLSTRRNYIFKPYADSFLRLIRKQVLDRNDTVSTSFATACGYLARIASDAEILQVVEFSKKLYFDSEDDRHRTIAGELLLALAKHATDRFAALASSCLPFTFFGMQDSYEPAKDVFKATWDENVGGSRAVQLYINEIIELCSAYLDSPRWSIKHSSAFAVASAIKAIGSEMSSTNSQIIWPALEKAVDGKTWDGKEKVLEAFVLFSKSAPLVKSDSKVNDQVQVGKISVQRP